MTNTTEQPVQTETTNAAPVALAATQPTNPLNAIKREYWPMAKLADSQERVQSVIDLITANNGISSFNFDPAKDFPVDYGLAIVPISKKGADGKMQVLGACIGAIPEFTALMTTPEGSAYARGEVETSLIRKLANATRPRENGAVANTIPFSISDFITSNRPEGLYVAFNKFATAYVTLLKSRKMKLMTPTILRAILESKAVAEMQFPNVPQSAWERIIDSIIAKANEAAIPLGALETWKATRDTAGMPSDEDVDLEDLDFSKV